MTAHPTLDVLALVALGEDVDPDSMEHVGECRTCFHEIGALQQVVAIGRSLGPDDELVAPHPRVWQRITSEVHGSFLTPRGAVGLLEQPGPASAEPDPAPIGGTPDELATRRRAARARRSWATVALAAAVALVVGLGGGFVLRGQLSAGSDVATTQLNALPGYPGANGTARVEDGSDGQRTLVVSMDLPATIDVDGTLEVWMSDTRAEDMIAMGTMASDSSGRFAIPASMDVGSHPIVDVSLEPSNDTDPAHSDISVVRGRLNV